LQYLETGNNYSYECLHISTNFNKATLSKKIFKVSRA
jgi:hypothetical protein